MTRVEIVKEIRDTLDRGNPGWRDALRSQMDAEQPGWVVATAQVKDNDDRLVEVALLANPERIPDATEIDPETDPFRE